MEANSMATLKVGDPAPDFEVQNDQNETVRLSDLRGKRVVLYFYPKDNTPGCTTQACGFRDNYATITGKNAIVLGVSPDSAASHTKFRDKFNLPFPLLVDKDHQLAESYGVWQEKSMMGKKYMGILRSHFVIDENGKLADVQYNVKANQSPAKALDALS
jgi:peroxiredoxin Q/BCP